MNAYFFPVLLQVIGFLVVVAEVFIPSMGMLSAVALGVFCYSLYLVYETISSTAFWVFMGVDLLVLPLVLVLALKALAVSPLSLKKKLSAGDGVVSQAPDLATHLHKDGESITPLRPAGMAQIEGRRLDVVTDGEFIAAGEQVRVVRVTGNQIIVEKIDRT